MMGKPTAGELIAARGQRIRDVIGPSLHVLLCGINPSLYSAAVRHHFARPGNRFWPALALAGITPRKFSPAEDRDLLPLGYGITNVVARATATAAELSAIELEHGAALLTRKVLRFAPSLLAVLGITAYRAGFQRPRAVLGLQRETIGEAAIWVLPNPSGLNAHVQVADLAVALREMHDHALAPRG